MTALSDRGLGQSEIIIIAQILRPVYKVPFSVNLFQHAKIVFKRFKIPFDTFRCRIKVFQKIHVLCKMVIHKKLIRIEQGIICNFLHETSWCHSHHSLADCCGMCEIHKSLFKQLRITCKAI